MRVQVGDLAIWIAPVEYVIIRKLEYFRMSNHDRHIRDVAMILRISGDAIDQRDLGLWIEQRGLHAELEAARTYPEG
jgi:hypothetical protein